jgi:hypothetical protein
MREGRFDEAFYDDEFVREECIDEACEKGLSYLEPMPNHMGGVGDFDQIGGFVGKGEKAHWVTVGDELRKTAGCNKTALKFERVEDGVTFYNFIKCWRWMCDQCGVKGGRIHNKRVSRILGRLVQLFKKNCSESYSSDSIDTAKGVFDLRQFVFTLPIEIRKYFVTRKDIQAFNQICERLIKKLFPDRASLRYFHGFGDKEKGVYNPHVNIHVFELRKKVLKLTAQELKEIKERYVWALRGYILQVYGEKVPEFVWKKIDFHYSFLEGDKLYKRMVYDKETNKRKAVDIEGLKLIFHRVEYMGRPCPGYCNLGAIKGNEFLLRLFVIEMKGFHYITNCGSWKMKDCDRKEERQEIESLAGGRLRLSKDNDGHLIYISRTEFDLLYIEKDYEELSDGFYRINEVEKKKKKKT